MIELTPEILARIRRQIEQMEYIPVNVRRKLDDDGFVGQDVSRCTCQRHGTRAVGFKALAPLNRQGPNWQSETREYHMTVVGLKRTCCGRPL